MVNIFDILINNSYLMLFIKLNASRSIFTYNQVNIFCFQTELMGKPDFLAEYFSHNLK